MKFVGRVGFFVGEEETTPGIIRPVIEERHYVGEVIRNNRRFQSVSDSQNDNLTINNQISILSDLYVQTNWNSIRYIVWNNERWKVNQVELAYPRIILEIGGVFNGEVSVRTTENS